MDVNNPGLSPPRSGSVIILKKEAMGKPMSSSPITLSPRVEIANPTTLQPRDMNMPIGVLGDHPVYVLPEAKQENNEECFIEITEEPEDKFRFRYKSEMQGTHGCIHSKTYTKKNKRFPTIQVRNVPADVSSIRLRVALYTSETPHNHHVHKVMWKQASESEQDFLECSSERSQGFRQTWQGLGIIHTSRNFIDSTLTSRITKIFLEKKAALENNPIPRLADAEELKLKSDAHQFGKMVTEMLNTVVLGFEAFRVDDGIYRPLCVMAFSNPINNLKNPSTGELKICRISEFVGSVEGGDEIFILIERVKKGDIKIRFFELDQYEERVWEKLATFEEGDVHHQYAIVFKTPSYKDISVEQDVPVFFELLRPSDGAVSEPKAFRYKPNSAGRMRKKPRLNPPLAMRSQPLPIERMALDGAALIPEAEPSLNVNNIIDILLQDPDYLEKMENQPVNQPYGFTLQNVSSDSIPDLLVFNKSSLQENIDSDSCYPSRQMEDTTSQLGSEIFSNLIQFQMSLNNFDNPEKRKNYLCTRILKPSFGEHGNSLLHLAVISREEEALKDILSLVSKNGCEDVLEARNYSGSTALHLAVENNSINMVKTLLDAGLSPDSIDNSDETTMHLAVRIESLPIIQVLLESQADPNIPSNNGKFPMHMAVEANLVEAVRLLEKYGSDIDAGDQVAGRTALHLAVIRNLEDMVRYLVKDAKVDIYREDYAGHSAQYFAESCTNQNIIKIVMI